MLLIKNWWKGLRNSAQSDEDIEDISLTEEEVAVLATPSKSLPLYWWLGIALMALLPRLYDLFFLTNPENGGDGWLGDVYHHWQIAYLTKEIGLSAPGGPRLWDLKGLEYFWGILHPYLLVFLFFITGSTDIIIERLLSVAFAVGVVLLIFALVRRYFGWQAALASALIASFLPVSVFGDASGMQEPLGVFFCLLAVWLWPRHGLLAGIALALASMARAEAWLFAIGLLIAFLLSREGRRSRIPMIIGFAAPMLVYMKILFDHTLNPIYPVYWNFLANAWGDWEYRTSLTSDQIAVRPWLGLWLVISLIALGYVLYKRPRGHLLLTFGFGYWFFTAGMLGFTAYLKSWENWFWMTRFFAFPYQFLGILLAISLFILLPRTRISLRVLAWPAVIITLLLTQLAWVPIMSQYSLTVPIFRQAVVGGEYIGQIHSEPQYREAIVNVPPGNPDVTYTMAQDGHLDGRYLISQLYDPFYYLPAGATYTGDPTRVGTLLQCWLSDTHTRLWLVAPQSDQYLAYIAAHSDWYTQIGVVPAYGWRVYDVHQPTPTLSDCSAAKQ